MINRSLTSVPGLFIILMMAATASANLTQLDLPYNNVNISATATAVNGYYDNYNWLNDEQANTMIEGSVDTLLVSKDDAWLKIGFGDYAGPGGYLVFYADSVGARHAYLQYTDGNVNSNVVDLASYTLSGPLYSFTITANEASGTFDATVTDKDGTYNIYGDSTNDLTGVQYRLFAAAITTGAEAKIIVDSTVSLFSAPAPEAIGLCFVGIGLIGWLRRRRAM